MASIELLKNTVKFSLIVQVITGIITLNGLFINVPTKDKPLKIINKLENFVQLIEAIYYVYIVYTISKLNLDKVVRLRYLDWFFTTPCMLISTIMFMEYKRRDEIKEDQLEFKEFFSTHKSAISKIVFFNFMMLLFGFLGETEILDKYLSVSIGFIFFGLTFREVHKFTKNIDINKKIFTIVIILWALYGVAAMLEPLEKNISYNILDMFSKNFYGLYIFYVMYGLKK